MLTQDVFVVVHSGKIFKQRTFITVELAEKYAEKCARTVANRMCKREFGCGHYVMDSGKSLRYTLANLDPNDPEYALDYAGVCESIEFYEERYNVYDDDVVKWERILEQANNEFEVKPATLTVK